MFNKEVAERGGFEPPIQFPVCVLSKDVPSATRPPFQIKLFLGTPPTA